MPYSYRTGTAASGVCICMFVCIIGFFRPGRKISDTRSAFYCNGSISQIHTNERGAEIKARPRSDLLVVRVCVCVCVCARATTLSITNNPPTYPRALSIPPLKPCTPSVLS
jgi:hypothetical protein